MTDDLHAPEAFGAFYRQHAAPLTAYFLRRTGDAEMAADLTAETFASALGSLDAFDPARGPAVAWLYGIARNHLLGALRRGRVEDRARRRLGMERLALTDAAIERIEALAGMETLLDGLPADQRAAVEARILDERDYDDIAAATGSSPAAVRQRVSRALSRLRAGLKEGSTP